MPQSQIPTIGVLSPLVSGFYFGGILDGIAKAASGAGFTTVAFQCQHAGVNTPNHLNPPAHTMRPVGWAHLAGFISIVEAVSDSSLELVLADGKPLVLVSHEPAGVDAPVVLPDNSSGLRDGVRHLVQHGHERIAFAGMMGQPDIRERYRAYCDELLAHGIRPDPELLFTASDTLVAGGRTAAAAMLAGGLRSSAVVAATDLNAVGIIGHLTEAGLRLPLDQAVVGFDGTEDGAYVQPSLSTVVQDFSAIGRAAAELLIAQIRGARLPRSHHRVSTRFLPRQSCGCMGSPSPAPAPGREEQGGPALIIGPTLQALSELDSAATAGPVLLAFANAFAAVLLDHGSADDLGLPALAEDLWVATPELGDIVQLSSLLRAGAETWLGTRSPTAAPEQLVRLEQLLSLVGMVFIAAQGRDHHARRGFLIESLGHQYAIGMDLLSGHHEDPTTLTWLSRTPITSAVLALHPDSADDGRLVVRGVYNAAGDAPSLRSLLDRPLDERDFPPHALLELAAESPGTVVVVLPLRGREANRGFLGAVAPVLQRDVSGRENFNQWAALLGLALDHQEVLTSLREQQNSLAASLDREQGLAAEIRRSEQRYALAAAATNDGLWDWDLNDDTVYYSDRSRTILGAGVGETAITAWLDRVHPDDRQGLDEAIAEQRSGAAGRPLECEHRIRSGSGETQWVLCRGLTLTDDDGGATRIVGSFTDVTERRELAERLRHLALYDSLTALPNRALLLDRLGVAMRRRSTEKSHHFALLFIDLDGFKVINDSLGHMVGDKLLVGVAGRLQTFIRTGDTAARIGGDEFVILLEDLAPGADLPSVTARLQDMLSDPFEIEGRRVVITASIGIAAVTHEHRSAEDMLRDADIAMYRAKARQRGGQATFDTTMRARLVNRMSTESLLRTAVDEAAFALHYQPIVNLADGEVTGFEALLRWPAVRDDEQVLVPPAEFLPVAEESGLIVAIGRWVAEEACRQLAQWRREASPAGHLPVSINVSHQEFWHVGLLDHLDTSLSLAGLEPQALALEITEGVIMDNPHRAVRLLDAMHERGLAVHIDDFGTGYSSLEALHRFRLDALKIDRSFVVAMSGGTRSAELVRTIIAMGDGLGLDVIAEGIEGPEQTRMLREFGCRSGQGYLFSKPLPAAQVDGLFRASLLR